MVYSDEHLHATQAPSSLHEGQSPAQTAHAAAGGERKVTILDALLSFCLSAVAFLPALHSSRGAFPPGLK